MKKLLLSVCNKQIRPQTLSVLGMLVSRVVFHASSGFAVMRDAECQCFVIVFVRRKARSKRPCLQRSATTKFRVLTRSSCYLHCQSKQIKMGTRIVKMAAMFLAHVSQ